MIKDIISRKKSERKFGLYKGIYQLPDQQSSMLSGNKTSLGHYHQNINFT